MGNLAAGTIVIAALVLANVVAGGVYLVLGPLLDHLSDGPGKLIGLILVGALGAACSIFFFKGFMSSAPAWLEAWRRRKPTP